MVCHHTANFGGYRHYGSGGILVLICRVILQDNMSQELHDFLSRSNPGNSR